MSSADMADIFSDSSPLRTQPPEDYSQLPGIPINPRPVWIHLPLDCKLPVPARLPLGATTISTTKLGRRVCVSVQVVVIVVASFDFVGVSDFEGLILLSI